MKSVTGRGDSCARACFVEQRRVIEVVSVPREGPMSRGDVERSGVPRRLVRSPSQISSALLNARDGVKTVYVFQFQSGALRSRADMFNPKLCSCFFVMLFALLLFGCGKKESSTAQTQPTVKEAAPDVAKKQAPDEKVVAEEKKLPPEPLPEATKPGGLFLWRIGEGAGTSWVFGTIHLPDERVIEQTAPIFKIIEGCDEVRTEVPMDMQTQASMTSKVLLPDGESLETVLPKDLYDRVKRYYEAAGIPFMMVSRMKIWSVGIQLVLLDRLMELAMKPALDAKIYSHAESLKKGVGGLETVEEQLDIFDSLSREEQIHILRETLDQVDEMKAKNEDPLKKLLGAYAAGDPDHMLKMILEDYDPNDPIEAKQMKRLFHDRNVKMAERMAAEMKARPDACFFFAVGAGHTVGDDGVIQLLKASKHKVERVAHPVGLEEKPSEKIAPEVGDGGAK